MDLKANVQKRGRFLILLYQDHPNCLIPLHINSQKKKNSHGKSACMAIRMTGRGNSKVLTSVLVDDAMKLIFDLKMTSSAVSEIDWESVSSNFSLNSRK
jgi:hypothetical protein